MVKSERLAMTIFDKKEWYDWLLGMGPISKYFLESIFNLTKKVSFSQEVDLLLKMVREYMLEKNFSVVNLLSDMGCSEDGISAKEVKKYLGKVVGY